MKAMQIDRFGGPEVLHSAAVAEPHAGRGRGHGGAYAELAASGETVLIT